MIVKTFFSELFYVFLFLLICADAIKDHCNQNSLNKPSSFKVKELILCDYDKSIRPVLKEEPLIISTHLLIHNLDFFEKRNKITIKGWGVTKWRDEHIYWTPKDYNNVTAIVISANDVWIPDLVIVESKYVSKLITGTTKCVAFYHKVLFCPIPINLSGFCKADYTYWPFDTHNCTISVESFYYTGDKIDFNDTETELHILKKYLTSWDIIDYDVKRSPGRHKCCPNISYPSLKFNFLVKRHFAGKIAFVLLPFIVLASLTILAIWLNPRSSERIYIAAVNISYHTYYLLDSMWELPSHSDCVPKLILLIRNSQILATVLVIETVAIRQLLNKSSDSPRWLKYFFSVFASSTFGKIFLYPELYSNNSIIETHADDRINLVEDKSEIKAWNLLGIFLDRFFFLLFIFIYIIMFINCIPK